MARAPFSNSFTQQSPIPEDGIAAAVGVMRAGRMHRYNLAPGEVGEAPSLERDFAAWQGARYCLAAASGGQAMQIALLASLVRRGDLVLTNGFTLAPVPRAIAAVGARPVLVKITQDLVLDLDDLGRKARSSGARHLLLSPTRGHRCDMDQLIQLAADLGRAVIEDCAHVMGASWNSPRLGNFGLAGCFSTQTYKYTNSGEAGLRTSDDAAFMARATILSGSYMLYERHDAGPTAETYAEIRLDMPNTSARMDSLRAALLRPQLRDIDSNIATWNARHDRVAQRNATCQAIRTPMRPRAERYVGSSIQFLMPGVTLAAAQAFVAYLVAVGVEVKGFGAAEPVGFTSDDHSFRFVVRQDLPKTDEILAGLFDMRLPLTFSLEDCDLIADHILNGDACVERGSLP